MDKNGNKNDHEKLWCEISKIYNEFCEKRLGQVNSDHRSTGISTNSELYPEIDIQCVKNSISDHSSAEISINSPLEPDINTQDCKNEPSKHKIPPDQLDSLGSQLIEDIRNLTASNFKICSNNHTNQGMDPNSSHLKNICNSFKEKSQNSEGFYSQIRSRCKSKKEYRKTEEKPEDCPKIHIKDVKSEIKLDKNVSQTLQNNILIPIRRPTVKRLGDPKDVVKNSQQNTFENFIIPRIQLAIALIISNTKSGHPGAAISLTNLYCTLFQNIFFDNRFKDYLIVSNGHTCLLLYIFLFIYDKITIHELLSFRNLKLPKLCDQGNIEPVEKTGNILVQSRGRKNKQSAKVNKYKLKNGAIDHSKYKRNADSSNEYTFHGQNVNTITPGHPEYRRNIVDATTGPLGQGIANAVGYAISLKKYQNDREEKLKQLNEDNLVNKHDLITSLQKSNIYSKSKTQKEHILEPDRSGCSFRNVSSKLKRDIEQKNNFKSKISANSGQYSKNTLSHCKINELKYNIKSQNRDEDSNCHLSKKYFMNRNLSVDHDFVVSNENSASSTEKYCTEMLQNTNSVYERALEPGTARISSVLNSLVLCIFGDGCYQEGISHEALSLAGHLELNNLILIYDCNNITIDGSVRLSMSENQRKRLESYNIDVINDDQYEEHLQKRIFEIRFPSYLDHLIDHDMIEDFFYDCVKTNRMFLKTTRLTLYGLQKGEISKETKKNLVKENSNSNSTQQYYVGNPDQQFDDSLLVENGSYIFTNTPSKLLESKNFNHIDSLFQRYVSILKRGFVYKKLRDGRIHIHSIFGDYTFSSKIFEKKSKKPLCIIYSNSIAAGTKEEGSCKTHGAPLKQETIDELRNKYQIHDNLQVILSDIKKKFASKKKKSQETLDQYFTSVKSCLYEKFMDLKNQHLINCNKDNLNKSEKPFKSFNYHNLFTDHTNDSNFVDIIALKQIEEDFKNLKNSGKSTRKDGEQCLEIIMKYCKNILIGSADLTSSCLTKNAFTESIVFSTSTQVESGSSKNKPITWLNSKVNFKAENDSSSPNDCDEMNELRDIDRPDLYKDRHMVNWGGNYIHYGIREHAMFSIANGIAYHSKYIPITSTFLNFVTYGWHGIRLACISKIKSIYVLTHDSIGLGEDGPTHQPVEVLSLLRSTPNLRIFRPCNTIETSISFLVALESRLPVAIILSRQNIQNIGDMVHISHLSPYVIYSNSKDKVKSFSLQDDLKSAIHDQFTEKKENRHLRKRDLQCQYHNLEKRTEEIEITILATGSEVEIAIQAAQILKIPTQVVSVPDFSLLKQNLGILRGFVVSIEAGNTLIWSKYTHYQVGIDGFGLSGKSEDIYNHFGLTGKKVAQNIEITYIEWVADGKPKILIYG